MQIAHDRAILPAADREHRQGGYTLIMTALLLVPLMLMAGFSIDVGGWYNRTNDLQRAADSAALAGVVWLPDVGRARTYAFEAAARNGFVNGSNNILVTVVQVGDRRLRVTVTDTKVGSTFYRSVSGKTMSFSRKATAEYYLPVPLGSPKNQIGTGDLLSPNPENFWLAASGYCASRENGDLLLTPSSGNYQSSSYRSVSLPGTGTRWYRNYTCSGVDANPYYDADGYEYAVEVPVAGTYDIQAYDATYQTSLVTTVQGSRTLTPKSHAGDSTNIEGYGNSSGGTPQDISRINTSFVLRGADDTPFDSSDNPVLSDLDVGTDDPTYANQWVSVGMFTAPAPGTYYLQVFTDPYAGSGTDTSWGSNSFGLRVGNGTLCSTIVGESGYAVGCPQIHGLKDMSILANLEGTQASFYLANVEATHAGKIFQVSLFDPGEGATALQILNPAGTAVAFDWSTPCNPPVAPSGGCSGSTSSLNLAGTNQTQPGSYRSSGSRYSDRVLTLDVQLPTYYTGGWWKVRYTVGTSPTDRTTWSARIVGDPVHLTEEA